MKITDKIPYSGYSVNGWQWTHNGNTYALYNCGICYYCYYNGKLSGAVDSAEDADAWASINHYTGAGNPTTFD